MTPTRDRSGEPWYADGLRFECTQCGACCRGEGYVWVDPRQVPEIADFLGLDEATFGRRYLRVVGGRLALVDAADGACVFWRDGCRIYPVRPQQCRTFPFWRENVASPAAWRRVGAQSPGVDRGRRYGREEIERLARGVGATAPRNEDRSVIAPGQTDDEEGEER